MFKWGEVGLQPVGCVPLPKSVKSNFSHKMGKKLGFCRGLREGLGAKVHCESHAPLKISPGYGPKRGTGLFALEGVQEGQNGSLVMMFTPAASCYTTAIHNSLCNSITKPSLIPSQTNKM